MDVSICCSCGTGLPAWWGYELPSEGRTCSARTLVACTGTLVVRSEICVKENYIVIHSTVVLTIHLLRDTRSQIGNNSYNEFNYFNVQ